MSELSVLAKEIKKWVVSDYFTPNIKAEVILDTLLTPYVKQMLWNECGIHADFLTKEMSTEEIPPDSTEPEDDRGAKIDYVFAGEDLVYLVELKTTSGSIKKDQAKRYIECCCFKDKAPKTFGSVFGDKLLRILDKKYGKPDDPWRFDAIYEKFSKGSGEKPALAMEVLRQKDKASTYKYLYTVSQILEACPGENDLKALWDKDLRLVYITPNGEMPHEDLMMCKNFYIHPTDSRSICLKKAVAELEPEENLAEYLQLLQAIVKEIYKE